MLNLLQDAWIPVIRSGGDRNLISPADITNDTNQNPIIDIDWPRPDFRVATLELLTGIFATMFPPEESDDWIERWHTPPQTEQLQTALHPFVHAFNLDAEGPRFLQDFENLVASPEPVERLLIETPGDSTTSKNTDLLIHRDRVRSISRATAAIALYTFQSWSPAGGAGNRTGLRGGGPLVAMVLPGARPSLWHTIWANVPTGEIPISAEWPRVFPWLTSTLTSEAGASPVTPQSSHPLQRWWGMPRRIRLDFTPSDTPQPCDLTAEPDSIQVKTWRQRPRGANYVMWGGQHPLTPYYQQKTETEKLPVHPQPGGIGYQHWLGLVVASSDGLRQPAATIITWRERSPDTDVRGARIIVAGFDMDNMKARGFVESEMPLPVDANAEARLNLDLAARRMVESADLVGSRLRSAVREALFSSGANVKSDANLFNAVRERFWEATQTSFFALLETAARNSGELAEDHRHAWLDHMRRVALALFDEAVPLNPDSDPKNAQRISRARRFLGMALWGYGPHGIDLFTRLMLPQIETSRVKRKRKQS